MRNGERTPVEQRGWLARMLAKAELIAARQWRRGEENPSVLAVWFLLDLAWRIRQVRRTGETQIRRALTMAEQVEWEGEERLVRILASRLTDYLSAETLSRLEEEARWRGLAVEDQGLNRWFIGERDLRIECGDADTSSIETWDGIADGWGYWGDPDISDQARREYGFADPSDPDHHSDGGGEYCAGEVQDWTHKVGQKHAREELLSQFNLAIDSVYRAYTRGGLVKIGDRRPTHWAPGKMSRGMYLLYMQDITQDAGRACQREIARSKGQLLKGKLPAPGLNYSRYGAVCNRVVAGVAHVLGISCPPFPTWDATDKDGYHAAQEWAAEINADFQRELGLAFPGRGTDSNGKVWDVRVVPIGEYFDRAGDGDAMHGAAHYARWESISLGEGEDNCPLCNGTGLLSTQATCPLCSAMGEGEEEDLRSSFERMIELDVNTEALPSVELVAEEAEERTAHKWFVAPRAPETSLGRVYSVEASAGYCGDIGFVPAVSAPVVTVRRWAR